MTTFDISFYCRDSKTDRNGFAPIEMSIIINGERATITLPRKERPSDYRKAISAKRPNDIKSYLDTVRKRLGEVQTDMMAHGIPLSATLLRDYFRSGGVELYTVEQLFNDYFVILRKRLGVDLTQKTFRKYELARDRLFTLVDKKKPVSVLNNALMQEYMATLNQDFDYVTSQGYCQKIKTVCLFAMANGKMDKDPFYGMKLRKGEKTIQFLDEDEVERLRDTPIENPSLNRIRDLFIFQINSGISYCDMAVLVPEDFQKTDEGMLFVHKQRLKTGIFYTSVIFPDGVRILEKYGFLLPILSNQKYNAFLKSLGPLCNVQKPLHTHVARHTYATMCLNRGIRMDVVAKLLGHSTTQLTKHYAKFLKSTIIAEVQDVFDIQPQEISRQLRLVGYDEQGIKK